MSLRRSARIATASSSSTLASNPSNRVAKYEQVSKPTAPPRKRQAKASVALSASKPAASEPGEESTLSEAQSIPDLPATPLPKKRKTKAPTSASAGASVLRPSHQDHLFDNLDVSPAKPRNAEGDVSPEVGVLPAASTDADSLLKDAEAFLIKTDEKLRTVVESHKCEMFSPSRLKEVVDPFTALGSGIIGQQVIFHHPFPFLFSPILSPSCQSQIMHRSGNYTSSEEKKH